MRLSAIALALGLLALHAAIATPAHAQTVGAVPLSVTITPQYPTPYQTVTVTPVGNLVDLNSSTVTITLNGKVLQKGTGNTPATFVTGPAGETDSIVVTADAATGSYQATATVRPEEVALVLEPSSTTHPFYEGGSLIAPSGRVRLVAVPNIQTANGPVPAASLVYTWKAGDQILESSSGIGRSTLIATAPMMYRDTPVSLTVSTQDGSAGAQTQLVVSPTSPSLLIYRDGPLDGPEFNQAISGSYTMQSDEESFRAVPYFFSDMPTIAWSMNGAANGSEPLITVRSSGQGAGTADLSVAASQPGSYQGANASLTVNFGSQTSSTNIFGL